ncbi:hypothetical protein MU852_03930 [Brevundimonas albigilva]|uniref:hypothetical protein n=1 Tax=Brevundimonas albigilva TaxID=1312364 RepID=UPI00201B6714|nr:hypothetical protein [Brevundimonas albigilva]UQV19024.1 hypothetical protein MU852_03930 [Brevundimonas albigilva]
MRPLFHPAIEDVRPEAILHALSDPERVLMYAQLLGSKRRKHARPCRTWASG